MIFPQDTLSGLILVSVCGLGGHVQVCAKGGFSVYQGVIHIYIYIIYIACYSTAYEVPEAVVRFLSGFGKGRAFMNP